MRRRPPAKPAAAPGTPPEQLCRPAVVEEWVDVARESPPEYWPSEPGDRQFWLLAQAWRRWQAAQRHWLAEHGLEYPRDRQRAGMATSRPRWRTGDRVRSSHAAPEVL